MSEDVLDSKRGHWLHLVMLALFVPVVFEWGWCLAQCWNWIMPQTFGLPVLSWRVAYCLSAVIGLFWFRMSRNKEKSTLRQDISDFCRVAIAPWFTVLIVWAVKP